MKLGLTMCDISSNATKGWMHNAKSPVKYHTNNQHSLAK